MTPTDDAWTGERLAVALDLIGTSGGGPCVLPVVGDSMVPTFAHGDAVRVDLDAHDPGAGDIVVFRTREDLVVHRFLATVRTRRHGRHLRLRGDGRPTFDPPVQPAQLLGIVTAVRRDGTWWDVRRAGARRWGLAIALHDHFWGLAVAVLRRVRLGGSRVERWASRFDRGTLRWLDRTWFRSVHRRLPGPPPVRQAGGESPGPLL